MAPEVVQPAARLSSWASLALDDDFDRLLQGFFFRGLTNFQLYAILTLMESVEMKQQNRSIASADSSWGCFV